MQIHSRFFCYNGNAVWLYLTIYNITHQHGRLATWSLNVRKNYQIPIPTSAEYTVVAQYTEKKHKPENLPHTILKLCQKTKLRNRAKITT